MTADRHNNTGHTRDVCMSIYVMNTGASLTWCGQAKVLQSAEWCCSYALQRPTPAMMRFSMVGSGLGLGILGYFMYEDWRLKRGGTSAAHR